MSTSDPAPPRTTPLRAVHESLGATMTGFAGWLMPLRYRSETAEHQAVRNAAGLFDLSHMGEIAVTGPGAPAALDYALVGRLSAVAPGRAKYTMICAPDGGVLDDLIVYRLADAEYLVVANAANTATVTAALRDRAAGHEAVARARPGQRRPQRLHAVRHGEQLEAVLPRVAGTGKQHGLAGDGAPVPGVVLHAVQADVRQRRQDPGGMRPLDGDQRVVVGLVAHLGLVPGGAVA